MSSYMHVDVAARPRKCNICEKEKVVEAGEKLVVFNSNSMYSKNICKKCFEKIYKELKE